MGTIIEEYRKRVADDELEADPAQAEVAARLDALDADLAVYQRKSYSASMLRRRVSTFGGPSAAARRC